MLFKHLTYLIIITATNDFLDGHSNEFQENSDLASTMKV